MCLTYVLAILGSSCDVYGFSDILFVNTVR